uniref:Uncharacterized protein n=1 Tax=Steinernema glaseri TaxID=37863 RepID=A0A1I7Z0H0_9BILA
MRIEDICTSNWKQTVQTSTLASVSQTYRPELCQTRDSDTRDRDPRLAEPCYRLLDFRHAVLLQELLDAYYIQCFSFDSYT